MVKMDPSLSRSITHPQVTAFLDGLVPARSGILQELEQEAAASRIPIITPQSASLLELLIRLTESRRILEVGTAIGYSALLFSLAAGDNSQVITIERNPELVAIARGHIQRAGRSHCIEIKGGDATEVLPRLSPSFDLIFLDGAKGHYLQMLDDCLRLLKPGGLLISDNILFRGMVASDQLVKRRKRTIVNRMRRYLKTITTHPALQTSLLSVGDGMAVSLKTTAETLPQGKGIRP